MKKASLLLCLALSLSLAGCGGGSGTAVAPTAQNAAPIASPVQPVELVVFAAASLTETLTQVADAYQEIAPNVTLIFNFDSSGTLKTQIQEGADCDVFLSAAQKQMNQLDASADAAINTEGLDYILPGTRINLLENKVVLVVPPQNPAGVTSFEDVATDKVTLVALGNSDVPVGAYSQEIFQYLGTWDALNTAQKITFGTNVKEVTSQVAEGAVDCGVVYATDAAAAGLDIVAEAPADSHKPVIYPAAVLNTTTQEEAARAFLDYLQTEAAQIFQSAGFALPS